MEVCLDNLVVVHDFVKPIQVKKIKVDTCLGKLDIPYSNVVQVNAICRQTMRLLKKSITYVRQNESLRQKWSYKSCNKATNVFNPDCKLSIRFNSAVIVD